MRSRSVPGGPSRPSRGGIVMWAGTGKVGGAVWEGGGGMVVELAKEKGVGPPETMEVGGAWLSAFVMMLRAMWTCNRGSAQQGEEIISKKDIWP